LRTPSYSRSSGPARDRLVTAGPGSSPAAPSASPSPSPPASRAAFRADSLRGHDQQQHAEPLSRKPSITDSALLVLDTRSFATAFPEIKMLRLAPSWGRPRARRHDHQPNDSKEFETRVRQSGRPALQIFQDLGVAYDRIGRYR
jgi:hypothetical protein